MLEEGISFRDGVVDGLIPGEAILRITVKDMEELDRKVLKMARRAKRVVGDISQANKLRLNGVNGIQTYFGYELEALHSKYE